MIALLLALQADALRNTRDAASYEVAFESEQSIGKGDPLRRKGTLRRWKRGVLIVDYEGSGGERVMAVRAGVLYGCGQHPPAYVAGPCDRCQAPRTPTAQPRVWVLGPLDSWVRADESSNPEAATGFTNPDDILRVLEERLPLAKKEEGAFRVEAKDAEAVDIVRRLLARKDIQARTATLSLRVTLRDERMAALEVVGSFESADGTLSFKGVARFGRFGELEVPAQLGDPKRPVRFSAAIRAAIDEALKP